MVDELDNAARSAIAEKGAFSVCVPGGFGPADGVEARAQSCVGEAMSVLAGKQGLDFSKFHVFFTGDRLDVQESYKGACETWVKACCVPLEQVHGVAPGPPEGAAAQYTALICMQEENVIADSPSGLPAVDLLLLDVGEDGTIGRVRPGSAVARRAGDENVVIPVEDPGQEALALSLDFMSASRRAVLAAAGGEGGRLPEAVAAALGGADDGAVSPAGLVRAQQTLWLLDSGAAADLPRTA